MTKDEALKLALEALETDPLEMVADVDGHMVFLKDKAITAIKKALAQTQEPVAWEQFYPDIGKPQIAEALAKEKALQALHDENERLGLYKDAYAEQEPMAWISTGSARMIHWTADKPAYGDDWVPLYTAPPQRKPLTDEDVERIVREARVLEHGIGYTIARAIEAAHNILEQGDKNEDSSNNALLQRTLGDADQLHDQCGETNVYEYSPLHGGRRVS